MPASRKRLRNNAPTALLIIAFVSLLCWTIWNVSSSRKADSKSSFTDLGFKSTSRDHLNFLKRKEDKLSKTSGAFEDGATCITTQDPNRPVYHFTVNTWMNDPIPFYYNGQYHIFFQYNPGAPIHGDMHWGHAASVDLLHWVELAIALAPGDSYDSNGVWTGAVVRDDVNDRFVAIYTGIDSSNFQSQAAAFSKDLETWTKFEKNPILRSNLRPRQIWRDPHVWREQDKWYMLIGADRKDGETGILSGGVIFLYEGDDSLVNWKYSHNFTVEGKAAFRRGFECPDFFKLGKSYVVLVSQSATYWMVGHYDAKEMKFERTQMAKCDGNTFYAAKTLEDTVLRRRLLFGWIREDDAQDAEARGWAGVLSMPRQLSTRDDGSLIFAPPEDFQRLRTTVSWVMEREEKVKVPQGTVWILDDVTGYSLEIEARLLVVPGTEYTLYVRCKPDGKEGLALSVDPQAGRFGELQVAPIAQGEFVVRIYLDHSVIEAFLNDEVVNTFRHYLYPTSSPGGALSFPEAAHVAISARGGDGVVVSMTVWQLRGTRCGAKKQNKEG